MEPGHLFHIRLWGQGVNTECPGASVAWFSSLPPDQRAVGIAWAETGGEGGVWLVGASLGINARMTQEQLPVAQLSAELLLVRVGSHGRNNVGRNPMLRALPF